MSGRTPAPASGGPRAGWLARLFGGRRVESGTFSDPALLLARDWLLARGGRVSRTAPDLIEGALPDGTPIRYTSSARRAREELGVALLAQGTPEWAALQGDIAGRAAGRVYRVRRAPEDAVALARAAFAPPATGCGRCTETADAPERGPLCAACPLRLGQVVADAGEVRRVTVEGTDERLAYEYAFRLRVSSARAEREEIMRVALDGASGARLAPLDGALLAGAEDGRGALGESEDDDLNIGARLAEAERLIEAAAGAAGRLARARALPEYQRRQDELAATFDRLLLEDPATGREALAARERALERLAEAHAIGVETQLVAVAGVVTPLVVVRVRFGGGAETRAEVDPCRRMVTARCAGCGGAWRVGARCGEGHVTCLACQERCVHCGARRCAWCAASAYTGCAECGGPTCAACARVTARGRHRMLAAQSASHMRAEDTSQPAMRQQGAAGPDDLSVADMDAMTPATWRECVSWLLDALGYMVERKLDDGDPDLAFVCRARHGEARRVVAVAHRPGEGVPGDLAPADLERAQRLGQQVEGALTLLLTTARTVGQVTPDIEVMDRERLTAWLAEQRGAHQIARDTAAAAMDERATVAGRVRSILIGGLERVRVRLDARPDEPGGDRDAGGAGDLIVWVETHLGTARRALAALETLIGEWEAVFAPTASREGTQTISATRDELHALAGRAEHLLGVLRDACDQCAAAVPDSKNGQLVEWVAALHDELSERCQALAARVRSLDPAAWRDFAAVRDGAAAREGVEHEGAARRAAVRAQTARDALAAVASRQQRGTRSAAARKKA